MQVWTLDQLALHLQSILLKWVQLVSRYCTYMLGSIGPGPLTSTARVQAADGFGRLLIFFHLRA